jgi:flagellar M-ring protein FliF
VPLDDRDATRLALAGEGLPASGTSGYELLDNLSGFGTTSQMFDAAYWRAKEGELARTILSSSDIRMARVHISNQIKRAFSREVASSASVTVTMARGRLSEQQAQAIRYMVSSAVAGLVAEDVAIIDSEYGVVLQSGETTSGMLAGNDPAAKSEKLRANIQRLLEAHVGTGRAVVEVMVEADMDSQTISERVIDPTSRIAISSDSEERTQSATGTGSQAVTVASNLPDGDVEGASSESNSSDTLARERLNFEFSETRRERVILPGQVRRISVAVMVDGRMETAADGSSNWVPRSDEEIDNLKTLVESAIGFDAARGDIVTIQSMQFPEPAQIGTELSDDDGAILPGGLISIIQTGVLAVVALLLGLFVVRPILTQQPRLAVHDEAFSEGELIENDVSPEPVSELQRIQAAHHGKISNLRKVISERADESSEVLRRWIESQDPNEETS